VLLEPAYGPGDVLRAGRGNAGLQYRRRDFARIEVETEAQIGRVRRGSIPAIAIARAILFAIEQPDDVDVNEIIVRPTASPH
jgi:NADP-dependent 3-hydroxy acid dehydrogenase YdfG